MARTTKFQKLIELQKLARKLDHGLDEFINIYFQRQHIQAEYYAQRKARGLCLGTRQCKTPPVENRTLCEYHLRKQAQAGLKRFNKLKNGVAE